MEILLYGLSVLVLLILIAALSVGPIMALRLLNEQANARRRRLHERTFMALTAAVESHPRLQLREPADAHSLTVTRGAQAGTAPIEVFDEAGQPTLWVTMHMPLQVTDHEVYVHDFKIHRALVRAVDPTLSLMIQPQTGLLGAAGGHAHTLRVQGELIAADDLDKLLTLCLPPDHDEALSEALELFDVRARARPPRLARLSIHAGGDTLKMTFRTKQADDDPTVMRRHLDAVIRAADAIAAAFTWPDTEALPAHMLRIADDRALDRASRRRALKLALAQITDPRARHEIFQTCDSPEVRDWLLQIDPSARVNPRGGDLELVEATDESGALTLSDDGARGGLETIPSDRGGA